MIICMSRRLLEKQAPSTHSHRDCWVERHKSPLTTGDHQELEVGCLLPLLLQRSEKQLQTPFREKEIESKLAPG